MAISKNEIPLFQFYCYLLKVPHERNRYLGRAIQHSLKHAALVAVLGQRQTGKTTLVRQLVGSRYVSLDDTELLHAAENAPKDFLMSRAHPFAIDECQLAPALFPALKLHAQRFPGKGQFILTGSVRFSARKAIRESLTGRIQILELHPMTLAEAEGREIPDILMEAGLSFESFRKGVSKRLTLHSWVRAYKYLETGGLPGICFLRDDQARRPRFSSHLDTILGRDLSLVSQTNLPVMRLRDFLAALAQRQGEPLALTEIARMTRISVPALRKLLDAFEALYLIRRVLPLGDIKKESFFLEDQGTASYLARPQLESSKMLRLAFSQIYPQLDYHDAGGVMTYRFETRNGACIPLVFKTRGAVLGILPLPLESPDQAAMASVKSFLKHEPKARVLLLTRGAECVSYSDSVRSAPLLGVI